MIISGFNYFCDAAGITGNMQIFYPFISGQNNNLNSIPFGKTRFSGSVSTPASNNFFGTRSGSGFFDGSTIVSINNITGFSSNTWTAILSFELSGQQNGILWSNYTSGSINSGWALGINNSCKPYLEFYTDQGPSITQSESNWGTKNTLLLTKTSNNLTIDYFNYNSKLIESENFLVDDNFFFQSNRWLLGGYTGSPGYFSGQKFKGFIDCFAFFSPSILPNQKLIVTSGLYSEIIPPANYITSGITSIVTGYSRGFVPIFSGTTGKAIEFFNYITGDCGSVNAKYIVNNLTGIIYDISTVPVTQSIINYFTGVTGGFAQENTGYSQTFCMDSITYLKDVNTLDFSEIFAKNTVNLTTLNNNLLFDRILNTFILPNSYSINQINFYLNSVAQFISGYSLTGGYYDNGIKLSGTAFVSGNILSGINYDGEDSNILDIISGDRVFNTGNYSVGIFTGIAGLGLPNSLIFLNGVKLTSGMDYRLDGINFFLNDQYFYMVTGNLWTYPRVSGDYYLSGTWNNLQTSGFGRRTSQLFMNGVRQSINNDYFEISKFSPLNNNSNFIENLPSIYNNNGLFME